MKCLHIQQVQKGKSCILYFHEIILFLILYILANYHCIINLCVLDVQDLFCFGEEVATVENFETLVVNITRHVPACNKASILVHLFFVENGLNYGELHDLLFKLRYLYIYFT